MTCYEIENRDGFLSYNLITIGVFKHLTIK